MKRMTLLLTVLSLALLTPTLYAEELHVTANLVAIGDSGVSGRVQLEQLPGGGTNINIVAKGLIPGEDYLSLYYENHTCELEPYSEDDIIATYTANAGGRAAGH